ncbi:carboxylating nicotinate-nucleotide diphosphorylase [Cohnella sp. CFH 77786]|uniref:carboxylating nicotinate-nucleotide diphosphorylase n=1 Tax=Cohnella sp. CFH 77786 TaxID=2662265 RepID=UPI001C60B94B|nr:carboxylating nicotinate-nucleotide diphosphorylase [Cohnella sp. CFH 77786]MBW5449014.1 carboxylating nicotinate-nucleotide diphosphorylase [Cohnella sp. CFH 77786]
MFERESDWMIPGPAVEAVKEQIRRWLAEDIGSGDVTTMATVPPGHVSRGIIHAKQSGIAAGIPLACLVFGVVDESLRFQAHAADGDRVERGTVLAVVEGSTHAILTGERLALNLMQRLSGIATKTRAYVDAAGDYPVRIADTRKTTPGHRTLEKYAVRVGGGYNHRFGLFDAVMIKDNHIKAAGGITAAVASAKARIPHTMSVEVEAETVEQALEAVRAGAHIVMFDNMTPEAMKAAAAQVRAIAPHVVLEASGGLKPEQVAEVAASGVDVISAGSLTHSFQALDISLDLNEMKGVNP